jgi:streptogramin lyase
MRFARTVFIGVVVLTLFLLVLTLSFAQGAVRTPPLHVDGSIVRTRQHSVPSHKEAIQTSPHPSSSIVSDTVAIVEYTLPVSPTNLLIDQTGDIWFTSFWSHQVGDISQSAIGRLAPTTGEVSVYAITDRGNVWGLKEDSAGNLWYTTVNGNSVGRLEPSTNWFMEWLIPGNHFGLDLDQATGDVWFSVLDDVAGIQRLSPTTNQVTTWSTFPYPCTYDLDVAANGDVWFTVQPCGNQGVGRLDPTTNQITVWTMPIVSSRPFRVVAETDNSIWFTEFASVTNSIAQLVPSTNTLSEYRLPTPNGNPGGLIRVAGRTWFTAGGSGVIGQLDPALGSPVTTILTRTTFFVDRASAVVVPTSYTVVAETAPTNVAVTPITRRLVADGFTESVLPEADSGPWAMASDSVHIWFSESDARRIGKLIPTYFTHFLPLVLNDY